MQALQRRSARQPIVGSRIVVSSSAASCRERRPRCSGMHCAVSQPPRPTSITMVLQMLDDATTDGDLRVPPSNHFEKLRGALAGWHSIRVNEQWRLVFRWHAGTGEAQTCILTSIATGEVNHAHD